MNGGSGPKRMLRIEEGQHYLLEPNDELPYKLLRNLGQGGFANVEEVEDKHTGVVLACKVFKFGGSSAERQRLFNNEVKVIRRLASHHHVTQIFATYVGKHQVGILLTPVADRGSLDIFLQDAHEGELTQSELATLRYSFGCLASGLRFMHAQKVRHKDIKPHNILVHQGSFIYTDFGSSLDYSEATRSITTGRPTSITRKYAAPELHEWSPRSSKTDIFSLGCVYLEILSALVLGPLSKDMTPYHDHIEGFFALMRRTSPRCDIWLQVVIDITCQMLSVEPEARPSAGTITSQLSTCYPDAFCGQCIRSLGLHAQAGPPVYSVFTPAIAEDSRFSQNSPMSYDPGFQSSATPIFEANHRYDLLFQQQMLPQAESLSTSGEQYHINAWAYPGQAASSLQIGDVLTSPEHLIATQPASSMMEPHIIDWSFLPASLQPSSDTTMGESSGATRKDQRPAKRTYPCPECGELLKCNSEFKYGIHFHANTCLLTGNRKHMLKHTKPFKCDVPGCKRTEGFATVNDLERHKKSLHRIDIGKLSYQCAIEDCSCREKIWPRVYDFKQHVESMHKEEDVVDVLQRYDILMNTIE